MTSVSCCVAVAAAPGGEKKIHSLNLQQNNFTFSTLGELNTANFTRSQVKEYFLNSYQLYDLVFAAIKDDSYFNKSPDRLRLPLIFYFAHTASVYVNKLILAGLLRKRVNKKFETLFEQGVDEMSWDDTEKYRLGGCYQWPTVSEVMQYRKQVCQTVLDVIDNSPLELPVTPDHPWWSVFMGIEHERIHFETTAVLINQLPVSMLQRPAVWKYAPASMSTPASNELITVPAGEVVMGKPETFPSYGWDNEYGQVTVNVPEFEASKYLVTNREFLEFVEEGCYKHKDLWTEEGWQWVTSRQVHHPIFWVCGRGCKSGCGGDLSSYSHCIPARNGLSSDKYRYRALYDEMAMPWDWPVITNYHEMKAFCRWKGPQYRAPTEAEHHRMRGDQALSLDTDCDPSFNTEYPANINLKYGSPCPVNMFEASPTGHYDVYGNVWEWGEDHFNGLPGFNTCYLYDDFSSPFFDGRHTMMMGGSWVTTGSGVSRFYRLWFRRHFFQYAGFRYVCSSNRTPVRLCKAEIGPAITEASVAIPNLSEDCYHEPLNPQLQYETPASLERALHREYGNVEGYVLPVMETVERVIEKYGVCPSKAIVLGSGTGHTTFLLTKLFQSVIGVDFCGKFVETAMSIQQGKDVEFGYGKVASLSITEGVNPSRATFKQLEWIPNEIAGNDLTLCEFIDRVEQPKAWLYKLWETITPQGLIVIVGSKQWTRAHIESYTVKKWLFCLEEISLPDSTATIWRLKSI